MAPGTFGVAVVPVRGQIRRGEHLQRVRGLVAAALIGVPLGAFLFVSLHASREIAALVGSGVGLAIFAVVATGTDAQDAAADAAWRQAAPDLPPASDRITLERNQATMPGPEKGRRTSPRPRDDR
jgi:hypothetical protein